MWSFNTSDGKFIERGCNSNGRSNNRHLSDFNENVGVFVGSVLFFLGALTVCIKNADILLSSKKKCKKYNNK